MADIVEKLRKWEGTRNWRGVFFRRVSLRFDMTVYLRIRSEWSRGASMSGLYATQ